MRRPPPSIVRARLCGRCLPSAAFSSSSSSLIPDPSSKLLRQRRSRCFDSSSEQNADSLRLPETALTQGYRLVVHDEIGSTNDEAVACARAGDPGKLWIVARAQTRGRGRQGRQWTSPPGNLYTSLLLLDAVPPPQAPELGFVVGIALARALRFLMAGDPRLRIKWPNDILFEGAKLAGILLESVRLADGRLACVIGIGVNCRSHPEETLYPATDLSAAAGRDIAPEAVFELLAGAMARQLGVWTKGAGFAAFARNSRRRTSTFSGCPRSTPRTPSSHATFLRRMKASWSFASRIPKASTSRICCP